MLIALIAFLGGYYLAKHNTNTTEGFATQRQCNVCTKPKPKCECPCKVCDKPKLQCGCKPKTKSCKASDLKEDGPEAMNKAVPPAPCPVPDYKKYVLKSTIPPCPGVPDMSRYMLKTECPSQPDMSKYVLKSSVPKCPPCISTCSKPCKIGECPPCPRPRCPTQNCPEPKPCPACPSVNVEPCPEPRIQCKASSEPNSKVRPMLASTSQFGL